MYLASEPYDTSVSAASMTPSRYFMPSTDVPVVMGRLVICAAAAPGGAWMAVEGPREDEPPDWRERDMIMTRMISTLEVRGWEGVMVMMMMMMMTVSVLLSSRFACF